MSRLALVTPLPPAPTGIGDYSVEVARLLASRHELDLFHDGASTTATLPEGCTVQPAREFPERHRERPYALAVHQLGNGPAHDFQYPLLQRVPGLLVLHDLVLHHARARMFLEAPEVQAYRSEPSSAARRAAAETPLAEYAAEVAYSHPETAGRLPDVQLATVGDLLPYAYPLFRLPVEASRAVAVHNEYSARAVREAVPGKPVQTIAMPVERVPVAPARVSAVRARHGFAPDDLVVGSFGFLTREKRIGTVARAVARTAVAAPRVRLLLVGPVPDEAALRRALADAGVEARTVVAGRVPLEELPGYIEAADVVAHLRYPTARETSAALLRVLAQGRPTAMTDLEHLSDIPDEAVLRLDPADEEGGLTRALLRLGGDRAARQALGDAAAAFVARSHSLSRAAADYESAIDLALRSPLPSSEGWPRHWQTGR